MTLIGLISAARPRLLPFVLLLVLAGYGWAHWESALPLTSAWGLVMVLLSWTALHSGTLWWNAARDRDEGPVLFGEPGRGGSVPAALIALVTSVLLAASVGPWAASCAAVSALLAVGYSHSKIAWKGHPFLGPLVNFLGYGLLSPAVGYAVVGPTVGPRTVLIWVFSGIGVLSMYFVAQAFQQDEDRSRGDRTLVATGGPRAAIAAARICLAVAASGGLVLVLAGWLPTLLGCSVPLWFWVDRGLRSATHSPSEMWARAMVFRLGAAAVAALLFALMSYVADSSSGGPVAGLATNGGHP